MFESAAITDRVERAFVRVNTRRAATRTERVDLKSRPGLLQERRRTPVHIDQAHIPAEHVEELREVVDSGVAKKHADRRYFPP